MSETSASLHCRCWVKTDSGNPLSLPSNKKVYEVESLIRWEGETLSTLESALANSFWFISVLSKSVWYVQFCSTGYFGNSCFVTAWKFTLSYTVLHKSRDENQPLHIKTMAENGEISDCFEVLHFFGCWTVFSLLPSISFWKKQHKFFMKTRQVMTLQASFGKIYCEFAQELDKLFWARLKEKNFANDGKCLQH